MYFLIFKNVLGNNSSWRTPRMFPKPYTVWPQCQCQRSWRRGSGFKMLGARVGIVRSMYPLYIWEIISNNSKHVNKHRELILKNSSQDFKAIHALNLNVREVDVEDRVSKCQVPRWGIRPSVHPLPIWKLISNNFYTCQQTLRTHPEELLASLESQTWLECQWQRS